jgi:hypothetical protein
LNSHTLSSTELWAESADLDHDILDALDRVGCPEPRKLSIERHCLGLLANIEAAGLFNTLVCLWSLL